MPSRVFWEYFWVINKYFENSWAGMVAWLILVNSSPAPLFSPLKKQHDAICVVVCVFLCVCVRGVIRTVKLSHLIAALLLIASPQLLFTCNLTCQDATTSLHISPLWTNDFLSLFSSLFFSSFSLHPPHCCAEMTEFVCTEARWRQRIHLSGNLPTLAVSVPFCPSLPILSRPLLHPSCLFWIRQIKVVAIRSSGRAFDAVCLWVCVHWFYCWAEYGWDVCLL